MGYIKCPRCELNYIKEGEDYCDVCKAELKLGPQLLFAGDDEDDEFNEERELCPVCKQNYISGDEEMCASCREEAERNKDENDESWRTYLDEDKELLPEDDDTDPEMVSLFELEKEEEEEEEDLFDENDEENEALRELKESGNYDDDSFLDDEDDEDEDDDF